MVAECIYNKANARLIATAPDMYEALNAVKRESFSDGIMIGALEGSPYTGLSFDTQILITQALAKAEGKG